MERQIGEIFQDGEVTLKVEVDGSCIECYYHQIIESNPKCRSISCMPDERQDQQCVIFVKQ